MFVFSTAFVLTHLLTLTAMSSHGFVLPLELETGRGFLWNLKSALLCCRQRLPY